MANRVALYLQDDFSLRDSIRYVQYAESQGFDAVWQAESRLARDALVTMGAYAATTTRIKIGSGVINNWTRNPAAIAAALLTLDDLAPDRVICGIGSWYEPLAQQVGVVRHKPLLAMREVVTAVKLLLAGRRVSYRGEFVQLEDAMLDVIHGRREPRRVPVYIASNGPKMAALAGEIADGVLLNYLVSPAYNAITMDELARGAQKAGRSLDSIDRPQLVLCSVDADGRRAINAARRIVTQYLAQQPRLMRACGVRQELLDEIAQVMQGPGSAELLDDAARLVPDDVVQMVTASGTPEQVRAQVRAYISSGATYPVLYPVGEDVRYMIDVFRDGYLG